MYEYESPKITKEIFIMTSVIRNLNNLIFHFDFKKNIGRKSYIEVPEPTNLIEIAEELISTNDLGFPQLNLTELENMVLYMKDFTVQAFEKGKQASKLCWSEADKTRIEQYLTYKPTDFQLIAYDLAENQVAEVEFSWFVEGFCRHWANEWMERIIKSSN